MNGDTDSEYSESAYGASSDSGSSEEWRKKYKGYRFKSICDELKVDFKPRHKFTADLGGYAEKEGSESE